MTEQEWIACADSADMLNHFKNRVESALSDRKLRLFACACLRQCWHLLTEQASRTAVDVAERYAEGEATAVELRKACDEAIQAAKAGSVMLAPVYLMPLNMRQVFTDAGEPRDWPPGSAAIHASLLCDTVGNPWQPITMPTATTYCRRCGGDNCDHSTGDCLCADCGVDAWVTSHGWVTPTIAELAHAAYDNRLPDSQLCPVRLLVLADAIEEVGGEPAMVDSLRRPTMARYRGYHVLDILLGRQ